MKPSNRIKKINGATTIEGRDTTGRRAAIRVDTSAGESFSGAI